MSALQALSGSREVYVLSKLKGIIPPITTPFDANGEIDERAFRAQVKFLLTKGVHGVCVGGSTGEGTRWRSTNSSG